MGDGRLMNSQASRGGATAVMLSMVKEDMDQHNEDDSPTN